MERKKWLCRSCRALAKGPSLKTLRRVLTTSRAGGQGGVPVELGGVEAQRLVEGAALVVVQVHGHVDGQAEEL